MPRPRNKTVFTTVTLESGHHDGNLSQIEIIGIPGEKQNGRFSLNDSTFSFFDDSIGRPIFAASRRIPHLNWQSLKIWLYQSDVQSLEYDVPSIDRRDLQIKSGISESSLKMIYVLDNDLQGSEYRQWENNVKTILMPLFKKFIAPPQLPGSVSSRFNPLSRWADSLDFALDPYAKMKQNLFFDTLIVQVD